MLARVPAGWRGGTCGPLRPLTLFLGFVLHYECSGLRIIMSQAQKGLQGHVAIGFFRDLIFFHLFLEGKSCDEGRSFLIDAPDSPATLAYRSIIQSKCRCESYEFSWLWGQEVTNEQSGLGCEKVRFRITNGHCHAASTGDSRVVGSRMTSASLGPGSQESTF